VDRVGQGTELAGRYRLEERLRATPSSHFWRGVDTTLERPVGVRLVDAATAEDTLDAARRAAVVDDPRLLRILDVSQAPTERGPVTYVISELVEAASLADLLRTSGQLPAEEVRAMVGEMAEALAHAARSGLHHEALGPTSVLRTGEGAIKVQGLAVDAAAAGTGGEDGPRAERNDAVALVALVYAGLTGRWPLADDHRDTADLESAPLVNGAPAPPAELIAGVPNDLDTLCSVTFGPVEDGPRSPAELVEHLRPWSTAATRSLPGAGGAAPGGSGDGAAETMRPSRRFPVRLGASTVAAAAASGPLLQKATGAADAEATQVAPVVAPAAAARIDPAPDATQVAPAVPVPVPDVEHRGRADQEQEHEQDPDGYAGFADYRDDEEHEGDYDEEEPRDHRPLWALAAIAALLVVGMGLAITSLNGFGDQDPEPTSAPSSVASPAPPPSDPGPPAPPEEAPPEEAPVIAISGVLTLDPQGGDGENDELAPLAIDGDPATSWRSSTYNTATFGGLKDGVGLVVTLTEPAPVTSVTLQVNGTGGVVEVRASPGQGLEGSQVLGTGVPGSGPVTVTLDEPVSTQNLIIWVTELPSVEGSFRIELAEVQVQ